MISIDVTTFRKEAYADLEKLTNDFNKAVSGATEFGFTSITRKTPKRTGRARASWRIGFNRRRFVRLPKVDRRMVGFYADPVTPKVKYDVRRHHSVWISNNVEYIDYLEYGSHNYGPYAMVSSSIPNIRRSLNVRLSRIK